MKVGPFLAGNPFFLLFPSNEKTSDEDRLLLLLELLGTSSFSVCSPPPFDNLAWSFLLHLVESGVHKPF